jgi:excinuclease ABC subunit C
MRSFLRKLAKIKITPDTYRALPESAGIYVFFKNSLPIYIGKAINLKRRVSSYFDIHLEPKTKRMVSDATDLAYLQVSSELEALLLEARLIRMYMPKYNIAAKDDKHPLYIQITKEKYPRVITARKIAGKEQNIAFYGPFPSSRNVRMVLKMIRRIFPYSDHKLANRPCLYSHIGLCNPCPSEIDRITDHEIKNKSRKEYLKNIRFVKAVLSAKFGGLRNELVKEMANLSSEEKFEKATEIRNKIESLDYITQPQMPTEFYLQDPNLYEDTRGKELKQLKSLLAPIYNINHLSRIECFDVAHLAGTSPTASMVTFIKGEADKTFYRHFRIRQKRGGSDIDSMREVVTRRLRHIDDWGKPDLIIVDGGVGQVNSFTRILFQNNIMIPVVGIAKNPDRLVTAGNKIKLTGPALHILARIRNEAHRFARTYHHKLVSRTLIG